MVSRSHRAIIGMFELKNHTDFVHVEAHEDSLWNGVADLMAKGERNTDNYTTGRNSTQMIIPLAPTAHTSDTQQGHQSQ